MSCGNRSEIVTGVNKMINSPNYPKNYAGNLDCKILLITENETKIAIQFHNFSMVSTLLWGCWDWIDIYDGRNSSAEALKSKLCDYTFKEKYVIATGNSMFIRFQSHQDSAGGHFRFKMTTGKDLSRY